MAKHKKNNCLVSKKSVTHANDFSVDADVNIKKSVSNEDDFSKYANYETDDVDEDDYDNFIQDSVKWFY